LDGLLLAGYFLILVVPVYVRSEYLNTPPLLPGLLAQASASGFWSRHFVTVVGLFFHQLCNWAVPLHTHLFQYPFSITDLRAKEILVSCGLLLLFLWRLRGERRLAVFGLFWFLILYLPSSNLLPLGSLPGGDVKAGAHHLYPAHAGLCLLVAASLFKPAGRPLQDPLLPRCAHSRLRKILPPALALCAAGLLSIQTFRFASCFRSADRFYEGVLDQNPLNTGARQNYAWHKWYLEKDPTASERILLEGLSATPRAYPKERADLHSSLIRLYLDTGRSVEASTLLRCLTRSWLRYVVGNLYFWDIVRNHEQEITEISGAGSDPDSNSQPDGSQGDLSGRPDPSGAAGHGQAAASFQDVASQVNAAQAGAYNRTGTPCDGCGGASTRP
jgi:hypothetical protein